MPDESPAQPQTVVNVNMTNTNTAAAKAAAAGAAPAEEPKPPPPPTTKSLFNAYLTWVLVGVAGTHRSYLARPTWVWLALLWGQVVLGLSTANPLFFIGAAALLAADVVEIPGWVRQYNQSVAASVGATRAKEEKAKNLRTMLLHAAHRGDGRLTVTQAVMASGQDWDRVEGCLRGMVQAGYVDVDNEPNSGVIVYLFPELVGRPSLAEQARPDGRLVS